MLSSGLLFICTASLHFVYSSVFRSCVPPVVRFSFIHGRNYDIREALRFVYADIADPSILVHQVKNFEPHPGRTHPHPIRTVSKARHATIPERQFSRADTRPSVFLQSSRRHFISLQWLSIFCLIHLRSVLISRISRSVSSAMRPRLLPAAQGLVSVLPQYGEQRPQYDHHRAYEF